MSCGEIHVARKWGTHPANCQGETEAVTSTTQNKLSLPNKKIFCIISKFVGCNKILLKGKFIAFNFFISEKNQRSIINNIVFQHKKENITYI